MEVASLVLLGSVVVTTPQSVFASGGATAGGAYLLSAKQRYNDRVTAGVQGFLALGGPLESGDLGPVKTFFGEEDKGSWKDLSTAGYLLANAFRRNSTAAPDSLPAVKVRLCNGFVDQAKESKPHSYYSEMESICGQSAGHDSSTEEEGC